MGLFSSLRKTAKRLVKSAPAIAGGFATGGPTGAALAGLSATIQPRGTGALVPPSLRPTAFGLPALPPPGGLPAVGPGTQRLRRIAAGQVVPGAQGLCPVGFHPNKQDGKFGPKGSYCVRNRRMNVLNGRAASRAIRRIRGARKMLMRIERQLPKPRRSYAPRGHRARLTHE